MAEWLIEEGIGENRAIRVEGERIVAARIDWGDYIRPGLVTPGKLLVKRAGARRGLARLEDMTQVWVDALPAEATEGQTILLAITRAALAERGRFKLAQARPAPAGAAERGAFSLFEELSAGPDPVRQVRPGDGSFDAAGWDELVEQAVSGSVAFAGGSLQVAVTPAMTVIDVDGELPAPKLALAAVPAIAESLARLDIGGNVAVDFPTLSRKPDRQAVDAALEAALAGWPHERTAMNGFGLVQIVARLERPSLLALYQQEPERAGLQAALRRAEAASAPGELLVRAHPALRPLLTRGIEAHLARRCGRETRWEWDEGLAPLAPTVQAVPR